MKYLITIGDPRSGDVECTECAPVDLLPQVERLINGHKHNPDSLRFWKQADIYISEVRHVDYTLEGEDVVTRFE